MIMHRISTMLFLLLLALGATAQPQLQRTGPLKVSANGRYFTTASGAPFFWLGDTGWLLFNKLTREEAEKYLENRRAKGFNVIQAMLVHNARQVNAYGDSALHSRNVA